MRNNRLVEDCAVGRRSFTIVPGCCQSETQVRAALSGAGCSMTFHGDKLLRRLEWPGGSGRLELVIVSDQELGLCGEYSQQQLLDCAREHGYGVCPPVAGPLARLVCFDQPSGEEVFVGMEPILGDEGYLVFVLAKATWSSVLNGALVQPQEPFASGKERPNLWLLVAPAKESKSTTKQEV